MNQMTVDELVRIEAETRMPPSQLSGPCSEAETLPPLPEKMLRCLKIVLLMNGWDQLLWLSELLSDQTKGAGVGR